MLGMLGTLGILLSLLPVDGTCWPFPRFFVTMLRKALLGGSVHGVYQARVKKPPIMIDHDIADHWQ